MKDTVAQTSTSVIRSAGQAHQLACAGSALNEAAELEKLAMYPRVIVERELLDDAGLLKSTGPLKAERTRSMSSIVARDLDGVYFVDYFTVYPDDFDNDWGELGEYLLDLRELIKKLAMKRQPTLRLKHSWLRQKFNDVAEELEKSKFKVFNGHQLPEDEEDHFVSVSPFR